MTSPSFQPRASQPSARTMRPNDRRYYETHEWVKPDGDTMLVGITDFAVQALSNGNEADLVGGIEAANDRITLGPELPDEILRPAQNPTLPPVPQPGPEPRRLL